ncbi:hypothetical protein [Actinoplanes sp. NPDC049118]|uniref:hypothetical protein n=1 Tax=Actinoplanes sp. NPDC049118 TaxID=3155769 RepID=UPI0033FBA0D1
MTPDLPGTPGPKLRDAWTAMNTDMRAAFLPHLVGGTSADYLADWLTRNGTPVSASTIRTYRRTLTPDRSVTDE